MSRAYTTEEVRDQFMEHVRRLAAYWANLPDIDSATGRPLTVRGRCEGVAFSILNVIDGTSMALPSFDLVAKPHEDDKEFHIENEENWIEPDTVINGDCLLHEMFYKRDK